MLGSADTAGMPDVKSRLAFFCFEFACQDQPLGIWLESIPDFSHSEMRAARGPLSGMRFGRISSLAFLSSSPVAAFRGLNSDRRNRVCFATSWHAREIIAPEASPFLCSFSKYSPRFSFRGERCVKDTDHHIRHPLRHPRIFGRVRSRRGCTWHDDQFGRGQNTGLGWSDPTFVHGSVPKVIRGVAPAQLRGDRAEYFVRAAFHSRGPQ